MGIVGVLLLVCVPAIVGCLMMKGNKIRNFIFFSFFYLGLLASAKMIIDNPNWDLIRSFDDFETGTFLHYGVPLCFFSIVVTLFFRLIKKQDWLLDRISTFVEAFLGLSICSIIVSGVKFTNIKLSLIFLLSCAIALFSYWIKRKNNVVSVHEKLKYSSIILGEFAITTYLYIPNSIFLGNINEINISYIPFVIISIIISIVFIVCCSLLVSTCLSDTLWKLFLVFVFGVSTIGYVQSNFLNGALHSMDGSIQDWDKGFLYINISIWVISFVVLLVLLVKYYEKSKKVIFWLAAYICAVQIAALSYSIVTTDISVNENNIGVLTDTNIVEINDKNNILVFILDWYDESILEHIYEQAPSYFEEFSDFTWYQNCASKYVFTNLSLPYLLTGVEWEYDMGLEEYREYAYSKSNFLEYVHENNYEIDIYTEFERLSPQNYGIVSNYSDSVERKFNIYDTVTLIPKIGKYNISPFILKNSYRYTTSDIKYLETNKNEYITNDDSRLHEVLKTRGLEVKSSNQFDGKLKVIHMFGAHGDFTIDCNGNKLPDDERTTISEQGRGVLVIVSEYIKQLKQLGLYDDTTIIVTADHGQNWCFIGEDKFKDGWEKPTSNPILMVKPSYTEEKDNITINIAPVSQEEFIPTILKEMDLDYSLYGKTFDEVPEDEKRVRTVTLMEPINVKNRVVAQYLITGDIRYEENWKNIGLQNVGDK